MHDFVNRGKLKPYFLFDFVINLIFKYLISEQVEAAVRVKRIASFKIIFFSDKSLCDGKLLRNART